MHTSLAKKFSLNIYRTGWGIIQQAEGTKTMEEFFAAAKQEGADGVEMPVKTALEYGREHFVQTLKQYNLKYIGMCFTDGPVAPGFSGFPGHPKPGPSAKEHLDVFKAQVEAALSLGAVKINSHTGNDYMTVKQADELFTGALKFQEQVHVPVMHETHRKRYLHSPWVTRDFVPRFGASLKIVADLSHFICVAETNAQDVQLEQVVKLIAKNVHHIHARIGFDHGPQVNDPRAPEWQSYVEGHENWWNTIWQACLSRGDEVVTLTPEHGPPNYQHTTPYSRVPLADIWHVNNWVAQRQRERFQRLFARV